MGVTEETLRITNEIVYKGKNDARQLRGDLKTTETQSKKTKISMEGLAVAGASVAAGFAVVGKAAKVAYDTIQEGAQIQAASLTFDSLAMSIGSTSDIMLGELQTATRGTIDDMTLMQSASQFAAMGLANNSEEAAKLAQIGSTLGAAFRGDAAAGMEEFALLLANQSIPRLDSFGISAGAVRSRIAELTAEFPEMSRENAFMQAVMEQSEMTMAKLGDSTATTTENLAILGASAQNTKDAFAAATAEGVNPFLLSLVNLVALTDESGLNEADFWDGFSSGITEGLRTSTRSIETLTTLLRVVSRLNFDSPMEFWDSLNGAVPRLNEVDALTQNYVGQQEALAAQYGVTVEASDEFNEELEESARLIPRFGSSMNDMADAHDQLVPAANAATLSLENETEAVRALFAGFEKLNPTISQAFPDALAGADEATTSLSAATSDLDQFIFDLGVEMGATGAEMALLATATGDFTQAQIDAAIKAVEFEVRLQTIKDRFAVGSISVYQFRDAVQDLFNEINNLTDKTVTVTVNTVQNGQVVTQGGDGPGISEYAAGTSAAPGGMAMVGEFGPEMVRLPRGAQVVSTNQTHNESTANTFNASNRKVNQLIHTFLRRASRPNTVRG